MVAMRLLLLITLAGLSVAQQRSISSASRRRNQKLPAGKAEVLDFSCPEDFGYYRHPTDCTKYYVCVFGGALLESCTGGLVYSNELQTCDWPRNVGCIADPSTPVSTIRITDPRTAKPPTQRNSAPHSLTPSVSSRAFEIQSAGARGNVNTFSGPSSNLVSRQGRTNSVHSSQKQDRGIFEVQESTNRAVSVSPTTSRTFSFPPPLPSPFGVPSNLPSPTRVVQNQAPRKNSAPQSSRNSAIPPTLDDNYYSELLNLTDAEYFYLYEDLLLDDYYDTATPTTTRRPVPIRLNLTDNLLQYQDIDPAPSFSLSSTIHSNVPTSSITDVITNREKLVTTSSKTKSSLSNSSLTADTHSSFSNNTSNINNEVTISPNSSKSKAESSKQSGNSNRNNSKSESVRSPRSRFKLLFPSRSITTTSTSKPTTTVAEQISKLKDRIRNNEKNSNRNKSQTISKSKIEAEQEEEVIPIAENVTLKPLSQLSPNASFVKILTRQIGEKPSDAQSVKKVQTLKLRPLARSRFLSSDRNASKRVQSIPKPAEAESEAENNSLVQKPKTTNKPTNRFGGQRFGTRLSKSDKRKSTDSTPSSSKVSRFSSSRQSSILNIRPSYRLTSRLSSNHPSAKIQSVNSRTKSRDKSDSPAQLRPSIFKDNFNSPPSRTKASSVELRPKIQFPPRHITSHIAEKSNHRLQNFKRERLTESPIRTTLSTTESSAVTNIRIKLPTRPTLIEKNTPSTDTSTKLDQVDTEDIVYDDGGSDDYLLLEPDEGSSQNTVFGLDETVTDEEELESTNQTNLPENQDLETSTQSIFANFREITSTSRRPVTTTTSRRPVNTSTSRRPVNTSTSRRPVTTTTSRKPVTTSTTVAPKLNEKISHFTSTVKTPKFKHFTNSFQDEATEATPQLAESDKDQPKSGAKGVNPLLANLKKTHKTFETKNTEKEVTPDVATKSSKPTKSSKEQKSSSTDSSNPSLFPIRSHSNPISIPKNSSSHSITSLKSSAGHLGLLFPKPRTDVAVSVSPKTPTRSRTSSKSKPSRLSLKPVSEIVKSTNHLITNIWEHPARRPTPQYPQPQANVPATKCDKKICRLPDCSCGGKDVPGGVSPQNVPQMVLLTFDDSVNDLNKELYQELFERGRTNPNGCPISASFYISHEWTDYSQVQNLYADGHEIASHSITHSFGEQFSKKKWAQEIAGQREIMAAYGGVRMDDIRGMRAPFLSVGGNRMFEMLYEQNFTYDSSMPVYENNPPSYPYTLDYKLFHDCMIPPCPKNSFPGLWEVPMVMWQDLNGGRCSMGDACTTPPDAEGVYKMLIKNFERHYTTNRAPMGLFYHAAWFTTKHHKEGFIAFLDTISNMPDVWLVTNWQALQWTRNPVPLSQTNSYKPFQCDYPERPARCKSHKVCNIWHKGGVRYMRTCQRCPDSYPWVGRTGVQSPLNQ